MHYRTFFHPEPLPAGPRILPVFLPFMGCPGRCLYCDQHLQTGERGTVDLEGAYILLEQELTVRDSQNAPPIEVGFFGGTFTNLPREVSESFVQLAGRFKKRGVVSGIRCSTRPDSLPSEQVVRLRELGLDMVELGIQSFSDKILSASNRGYTFRTAVKACRIVHDSGLKLIVQLLPGLPEHGMSAWEQDVQLTIAQAPVGVRIYPCLVIAGTPLAKRWHKGDFSPWSLEETIVRIAWGVERFWSADIPVLRMGLPPEPGLINRVEAGPWHASFGSMVRGVVLFETIRTHSAALGQGPKSLCFPRRHAGEIWGHRGSLKEKYRRIGIDPSTTAPWDNDIFLLQKCDTPS